MALQFSGRLEEAIAEFEHALAIDPKLYEANYYFARFCFAQGDFDRASELFERAIVIRPDDYHSPSLLRHIYRALGLERQRRRSAQVTAKRAERELTLRPENAAAAALGATALVDLGERERAKDWAARALALDPDDLLSIQYCMRLRSNRRDRSGARLDAERAPSQKP
jgi:adenylate cyclase